MDGPDEIIVDLTADDLSGQAPDKDKGEPESHVDGDEAGEEHHEGEVPGAEIADAVEDDLPEDEPDGHGYRLVEKEGIKTDLVFGLSAYGEFQVPGQEDDLFGYRVHMDFMLVTWVGKINFTKPGDGE